MTDDQYEYNRRLIEEFRATRGTEGGPMNGRPLLLLTTTGARSGQQRTTPLMFIRDQDRLLVVASAAGALKHPDWYHNLVAHPDVGVEVGNETFAAEALVMEGAERQQQWDRIVEQYPFFTEHQTKTTRTIPLIELRRRS